MKSILRFAACLLVLWVATENSLSAPVPMPLPMLPTMSNMFFAPSSTRSIPHERRGNLPSEPNDERPRQPKNTEEEDMISEASFRTANSHYTHSSKTPKTKHDTKRRHKTGALARKKEHFVDWMQVANQPVGMRKTLHNTRDSEKSIGSRRKLFLGMDIPEGDEILSEDADLQKLIFDVEQGLAQPGPAEFIAKQLADEKRREFEMQRQRSLELEEEEQRGREKQAEEQENRGNWLSRKVASVWGSRSPSPSPAHGSTKETSAEEEKQVPLPGSPKKSNSGATASPRSKKLEFPSDFPKPMEFPKLMKHHIQHQRRKSNGVEVPW